MENLKIIRNKLRKTDKKQIMETLFDILKLILPLLAGYGLCVLYNKKVKKNTSTDNKGQVVQDSNIGGDVIYGNKVEKESPKQYLYLKITAKLEYFKSVSPPALTTFKNADGKQITAMPKIEGDLVYWLVPNTNDNKRMFNESYSGSLYSMEESDG